MGIEPRLLRFYAGALTARPLALVAEWLSEQQFVPSYWCERAFVVVVPAMKVHRVGVL